MALQSEVYLHNQPETILEEPETLVSSDLLEQFKTLAKEMAILVIEQHGNDLKHSGIISMSFEFPYGKRENILLEIYDGMLTIVRNQKKTTMHYNSLLQCMIANNHI